VIPTIGVLGGTFDPIHYGHLRFASAVRSALGLALVNVIPARVPPHRPAPVASPDDRLAMTRLGCAEFPGLKPDDREIRRTGPSYTVVTLQDLHNEDRNRPLALLLGTDALQGLAGWYRWEQVFTLAHLVVVERPGTSLDIAALSPQTREQWERRLTTDPTRLSRQLAGSIVRVPVAPQPISATAIRAALARGGAGRAEVEGLLPATILAYIERNQLYRPPTDAP
jgi:nicotinate-nucleotide adenylyltransferase